MKITIPEIIFIIATLLLIGTFTLFIFTNDNSYLIMSILNFQLMNFLYIQSMEDN